MQNITELNFCAFLMPHMLNIETNRNALFFILKENYLQAAMMLATESNSIFSVIFFVLTVSS